MGFFEKKEQRVIRLSLKKIIWTVIILILLGLAMLFLSMRARVYTDGRMNESSMLAVPAFDGYVEDSIVGMYKNIRGGQPNIADTREFMKVSYGANIQARNVPDVVKDVKNAVRDVNGRVDSINSSEKSGYVSFVVPKSQFEDFRDEIENITHRKLYSENISSENRLTEKQNIESQMARAQKTLAEYQKVKDNLDARHSQIIASLKQELAEVGNELYAVRLKQNQTQNEIIMADLDYQESVLLERQTSLINQESAENKSYSYQNQIVKSDIARAKAAVGDADVRDAEFTSNIETVSGFVSVRWVSLWQLAEVFSPIHPTIILVIIILIAIFFLNRRGYIPKVELV